MCKHHTILLALLLTGSALLTSCRSGLVPESYAYRPLTYEEAQPFSLARHDVFPDDVRQQPDKFTNTLVAWTGVATKIHDYSDSFSRGVAILAVHHYFNWTIDLTNQWIAPIRDERWILSLSSRGEGAFGIRFPLVTPESQQCAGELAVGDMLIVYGYPEIVQSNLVLYPSYLQAVKPQWYSIDLNYGRQSEPRSGLTNKLALEEFCKIPPFEATVEMIDVSYSAFFTRSVDIYLRKVDSGERLVLSFVLAKKSAVKFAHSLCEGKHYTFPQVYVDYVKGQPANNVKQ